MAYLYLDGLGLGALRASLQLSVVVISGFTAAVSMFHGEKLIQTDNSGNHYCPISPSSCHWRSMWCVRVILTHLLNHMISPNILVSVLSLWQSGNSTGLFGELIYGRCCW
jgi:hypothetical protein